MRLFVFFHQIFTISTAILWFRKAVIAGEWVVRRELREGRPSSGSTDAALQGRHQARLAICTNRHQCMGGHRQSPRYMAAKCQSGGFKGGSER